MKSADYTGIEWILNNIWPRRFLSSQLETKRKKNERKIRIKSIQWITEHKYSTLNGDLTAVSIVASRFCTSNSRQCSCFFPFARGFHIQYLIVSGIDQLWILRWWRFARCTRCWVRSLYVMVFWIDSNQCCNLISSIYPYLSSHMKHQVIASLTWLIIQLPSITLYHIHTLHCQLSGKNIKISIRYA